MKQKRKRKSKEIDIIPTFPALGKGEQEQGRKNSKRREERRRKGKTQTNSFISPPTQLTTLPLKPTASTEKKND